MIRHSSNNGSIEIDDARAKQTNPNQTKQRRANLGKGKGGRAKQSKGSQPAGPFCTAPDRPGHATPPGPSLAPLPITYHLSLSPLALPPSLSRVSTAHPSLIARSLIHSFILGASGAHINWSTFPPNPVSAPARIPRPGPYQCHCAYIAHCAYIPPPWLISIGIGCRPLL